MWIVMRHLMYYPSLHIPNEDYLDRIDKEIIHSIDSNRLTNFLRKSFNGHKKELIEFSSEAWSEFNKYLQNMSKFDRIYVEGWGMENTLFK